MPNIKTAPFNDLPDLPPPCELETKAILKQATKANSALAELRGIGSQIPQHPLITRSIGLQEALASSHIENIFSNVDAIYLALSDSTEKPTPATLQVLRYYDAFNIGLKAIQQGASLRPDLFRQIATTISQQDAHIRDSSRVQLQDATGSILYTPPEGASLIASKLDNLERFIRQDRELDPLIRLALLHYQFDAIYPLSHCNGQCSRIVSVLYIISLGLIDIPALCLSKYFLENRRSYRMLHCAVSEQGDWHAWVLFILQGLEEAAYQTAAKIVAIKSLGHEIQELVKERLPKIYSWELIELLFLQPYCKIRFLEERGLAKRQTAAVYLRALEEIGIVQSTRIGRENYFINRRFLNVLSD